MALDTKSHLYLLHVKEPGRSDAWTSFPHVRKLLADWRLMSPNEPSSGKLPAPGVQPRGYSIPIAPLVAADLEIDRTVLIMNALLDVSIVVLKRNSGMLC